MKNLMRRFAPEQIRELVLLLLIALILLFFQSQIPNYFNARFFNRISTSVAIVGVLAIAQTLVFLTRNYDLSIGSIVGFTAYFVGQYLTSHNDLNPILAVLIAIGMGAIMGAMNGVLVAYGKIPSIIVTFGTLALYRTILVEFSNAQTVLTSKLPAWVVDMPRLNIFSIGVLDFRAMVGMMLFVVFAFQLILKYLPYGRRLYAIGSNPDAAHMAGFPAQKIVFTAFVLCGALSGLAGFMFLSRFGNVTVVAGQGLEFSAIAAVVVGGVSNAGGSGSAIGALLGAIIIDLIENSLIRWPVVSEFWRDGILGILILLAVASDTLIMTRLRNMWARSELQLSAEHADSPHQPPSHAGSKNSQGNKE